jgi:excisionase family DNA binding protein
MARTQKFATDWNEVPLVMDLAYAAVLMGVTVEYLQKLSRNKEFPAFKFGRVWRIERDRFREYLEKQQQSCYGKTQIK